MKWKHEKWICRITVALLVFVFCFTISYQPGNQTDVSEETAAFGNDLTVQSNDSICASLTFLESAMAATMTFSDYSPSLVSYTGSASNGTFVYPTCMIEMKDISSNTNYGGRSITLTTDDGTIMTATFSIYNKTVTNATIKYNNGDKYVGSLDHGKKGEGTYTWVNGDSFTGTFMDDKIFNGTYSYTKDKQKYRLTITPSGEESVLTSGDISQTLIWEDGQVIHIKSSTDTVREGPQLSGKTLYSYIHNWEKHRGWLYYDDATYYFDENGRAIQHRLYEIDGDWYYFDSKGRLCSGWIKLSEDYYHFDEDGEMATGIKLIDEKLYAFSDDGKLCQEAGWNTYGSSWVFVQDDFSLFTGWCESGDAWYFFGDDGIMWTGWLFDDDCLYYMSESGAMQTGWVQIDGSWYYFNGCGVMYTGWMCSYDDSKSIWYYMTDSGAMATGWEEIGGSWYYFDASGAMQTGWLLSGNNWYYLSSSGAMVTGWHDEVVNKKTVWYWLDKSGAMKTGWELINGTWYYFNNSGQMVTGKQTIDGVKYVFDNNGAWVQ